jgi:death-on-curing protein
MDGRMRPDFLTVEDLIQIHGEQISQYGGEHGIRDLASLESAVSQPQETHGRHYLHDSLFEMAAAYLFHVTQNHAFVDGNKRSGLVAALVFLRINGAVIDGSAEQLYEMTMQVALGELDKAGTAAQLEAIFRSETTAQAGAEGPDPGGAA